MVDLGKRIEEYTQSDFYPFHMPGHKRRFDPGFDAYAVDITEIDPFDDLHHPRGILRELQSDCAKIFRAKESFLLVNGTSCGVLAAITAVMDKGEFFLLMDRGSHKSAYNAVMLSDLEPEYVISRGSKYGFYEGVYPQDVDNLLKKRQKKSTESGKKTFKPCLFVTSPTYDGITSDIEKLAELIHKYDGFLIVDEAHGAHFGMHDIFPDSAVVQGADIVIQGLHKTLPSPTQTSVLHICSDRARELDIARYLEVFESSSPSYILMSGISSCLNFLNTGGKERFDAFAKRLNSFYEKTRKPKNLHIYYDEYDRKRRDISKILIGVGSTGLTGYELYELLADRYHLRLEMAASFYVTALTSVMDSDEGFERLLQAVSEIDRDHAGGSDSFKGRGSDNISYEDDRIFYPDPVIDRSMRSAYRSQKENVTMDEAVGRVSRRFVFLYPPGIPVLAPGEVVTEEIVGIISCYREIGFDVRGLSETEPVTVEVCAER